MGACLLACLCPQFASAAAAQPSPPLRAAPMQAVPAGDTVTAITLDQALASANTANIDVITARLAVDTARANLRAADTAPNPVLSVNGVQVRPQLIGRLPYGQLVDTVARVDMPLERGGKRRARVGAAQALITAAESDLGTARLTMRAAVTSAYYDLKAAEERVAALRFVADSYAQGDRIAVQQQRAGALSSGDLARQRVESLNAEQQARQALTAQAEARLALATLIGREPQAATLATTGDWPTPAPLSAEPAEALALRRPDVQAANARVDAARRNLDGAHALRYPDVTVGAQYEYSGGETGVGRSVGVGFAVPLPVRNRYRGEVDAAGTALVQAEAQARKTLAVASAAISVARQELAQASDRRLLLDQQQLPAARRAADVAEFAYKNGASTLLELLDARRSLQSTLLNAIDARADEARALARLGAVETTEVN